MRILIINPNTSEEISRTIDVAAKKYASPMTEISTVNPPDGPKFITDAYAEAVQAVKVMHLIENNKDNYDVFIIACAADPGLIPSRTITQNVIGMGEAGIMTACAVAERFSFLRVSKRRAPLVWKQLHYLGIDQRRCASVRVVGSGVGHDISNIIEKRHQMIELYCEVGRKCVRADGAGAIVLHGAGIVDLKEILEASLKVPVISGVASAVKIAEQLPLFTLSHQDL
jgi:allantoin racemase